MALKATKDLVGNSLGNPRPLLPKGQVVSAANSALFQTIDTMTTRLKTAGYTDEQLNVMSRNDKVYALKKVVAIK